MPFQPGNKLAAGRTPKAFQSALKIALADGGDGKRLRKIAEQLVTLAEQGEQWAVREVADRLDGKPAQAIIGGEDDDPAIKTETTVVLKLG